MTVNDAVDPVTHASGDPREAPLDPSIAGPIAFSGQRLGWSDLPREIRERINTLAGARVTAESTATMGFSPGFAAVLELTDGSDVFVKAVSPAQNPESPDLARSEIRVARSLPDGVEAPRLLWSHDDGEWVILGLEVVHGGRHPQIPWTTADLDLVLHAMTELATLRPAPGHQLRQQSEMLADVFTGWQTLADRGPAALEAALQPLGANGAWVTGAIDDLVAAELRSSAAVAGDTLVHGDLRADNLLIVPERTSRHVVFLDWPHAGIGAPWLDLALMTPSIAMQGGGDPAKVFATSELGADVPADLLIPVVAALTGYFVLGGTRPAPPGIPNLPAFALAQAGEALRWLRAIS